MEAQPVTVVSGAIEVSNASVAGFQASIMLEIRASSGKSAFVTGGQVTVSNCHTDEVCHKGE